MPTAAEIKDWALQNLLPVLQSNGATVVEEHYDALENAEPFTRVTLLVFDYQGERFSLSQGEFDNIKDIEWLFRHWQDVQDIVHQFSDRHDPFHSDVHRAFKGKVKTAEGRQHMTLAYMYVCRKISEHTRLWTD